MNHNSNFVKREDRCVMPHISGSSFTGKQRNMKRDTTQTDPGRHSTSTSDPENKSRRRIQLACVRCRRRKIRCSGETTDGVACTNCKAANVLDCQFLRPDTTQLLPTPGSALAAHYQAMGSLVPSASADSIGRVHPYTSPSGLSPSAYDVAYPRSHSLSDLGNYSRVDSIQRESVYGNGFIDEYGIPYNMHSNAPGTMAEYYGSLVGARAWSSAPGAMATDLERSQHTILYTTNVPSFFPTGNITLSSEDLSANRLLPVPTTASSSSTSNTLTYLKDIDVTANGPPFMGGEEPGDMYSFGVRSSNSTRAKPIPATMPFSSTYGTSGSIPHDQKSEIVNPIQNVMMKYTAITDDTFDGLPITSSAFTRSGTAGSSDIDEPSMLPMNGPKITQGDSHARYGKSSVYRCVARPA